MVRRLGQAGRCRAIFPARGDEGTIPCGLGGGACRAAGDRHDGRGAATGGAVERLALADAGAHLHGGGAGPLPAPERGGARADSRRRGAVSLEHHALLRQPHGSRRPRLPGPTTSSSANCWPAPRTCAPASSAGWRSCAGCAATSPASACPPTCWTLPTARCRWRRSTSSAAPATRWWCAGYGRRHGPPAPGPSASGARSARRSSPGLLAEDHVAPQHLRQLVGLRQERSRCPSTLHGSLDDRGQPGVEALSFGLGCSGRGAVRCRTDP